MKATALSALALLLAAGPLRADPPGVVGRIKRQGGELYREPRGDGRGVVGILFPGGATDADLAGLCEPRYLESLDLSQTQITDDGLVRLAELKGISYLALRGCPDVTDEGVERLRKALPGCKVYR